MKMTYAALIVLLSSASLLAEDCIPAPVKYRPTSSYSYSSRTRAKARPVYANAAQIGKVSTLPASALPKDAIIPPLKSTGAQQAKSTGRTQLSAAGPEIYISNERWQFYSYP